MLIISIPKSASTSLLDTFGKLHLLPSRQASLKNGSKSEEFPILSSYHPDTRQLLKAHIDTFAKADVLYKQHILPTTHNIALLKNIKKVVLLRNPYDVLLAYHRGISYHKVIKKDMYHEAIQEEILSAGEWIEASQKNGFMKELRNFYEEWLQEEGEQTLVLHYKELIDDPQKAINQMEDFFGMPVTTKKIKLSKKRYSHHSGVKRIVLNFRTRILSYVIENNYYERLKSLQTYLRKRGIKWI